MCRVLSCRHCSVHNICDGTNDVTRLGSTSAESHNAERWLTPRGLGCCLSVGADLQKCGECSHSAVVLHTGKCNHFPLLNRLNTRFFVLLLLFLLLLLRSPSSSPPPLSSRLSVTLFPVTKHCKLSTHLLGRPMRHHHVSHGLSRCAAPIA